MMDSGAFVLDLPLIELFHRLRHAGLPLGVDEYQSLVRALQAGFGISDRTALARLCKTLWIKSRDEEQLFDYHFEQVMPHPMTGTSLASRSPEPQEPVETVGTPSHSLLSPPTSESLSGSASSSTAEFTLRMEDEIQVAKAVMYAGGESDGSVESYLIQTDEYFPITRREMKQSWRYLRRLGREGPPVELNVEATVDEIGRRGMLLEPVLVPRRVNHAEVILLIDQGGSMVPFHSLSRRLAETALRGGRLGRAMIYYFHNCPEEYLYRDPAHQEGEPIQDILERLRNRRTGALIFSDAGAARGSLNPERVNMTDEFLLRLKQQTHHIAWLNPMPRTRWYGTTGGEIGRLVPMFDISRRGLDDAISVLRGRLAPFPMDEDPHIRFTWTEPQRENTIARQRIAAFRRRFGQAHLSLAQQAAFPLALTPDLVYRLWASFQRDIHGENLYIPWVAVSDLLLSRLCNEVDHELYEMDSAVRTELLSDLRANPQFGSQRLNELSSFLLKYVKQQVESHDPDIRDFAQVQQWTVLAYTRPGEAAHELALALHASLTQNDVTEQIRMASLIETFAEPLVGFVPLLSYAKGVKSLARGDMESARAQFDRAAERASVVEVQGVSLPIPEWRHNGTKDAERGVDDRPPNFGLPRVPFHEQLRYERQRRGWSQTDLAEKVGCDPKTVQRWESGERLPRPYHRQLLSEIFGKDAEEFGLFGVAPEEEISMPERGLRRVAILSAIRTEYQAVHAHLTNLRQERHPSGIIYERGTFTENNHSWDVLIGETGIGNTRAAVATVSIIEYFKPDLMFFVGVAGGLKDVKLRDVVAATKVYGYESGKAGRTFRPRPDVHSSSYHLVQRARAEAKSEDWLRRVQGPFLTPDAVPQVYVAPIASGNQVAASTDSALGNLLRSSSDAVAVEMEGYGFLEALHSYPQIDALIIRGISDRIDDKAEADALNYQQIAAQHAAAFAFEVLAKMDMVISPIPQGSEAVPASGKQESGIAGVPQEMGEASSPRAVTLRLLQEFRATLPEYIQKLRRITQSFDGQRDVYRSAIKLLDSLDGDVRSLCEAAPALSLLDLGRLQNIQERISILKSALEPFRHLRLWMPAGQRREDESKREQIRQRCRDLIADLDQFRRQR
jgi:uncharacterized protein